MSTAPILNHRELYTNKHAYFGTPAAIAEHMLMVADIIDLTFERIFGYRGVSPADAEHQWQILEPSAGRGALADAICKHQPRYHVDCIEIDGANCEALSQAGHNVVFEGDFLQWSPPEGKRYDAVVMNPPFAVAGNKSAYIDHIEHAFGMLRPGAILVAIVPGGFAFASDKKTTEFRKQVLRYGGFDQLDAGTFKVAGSGVGTCMVWMRNQSQAWRLEPWQGAPTWHAGTARMYLMDNYAAYQELQELFRRWVDLGDNLLLDLTGELLPSRKHEVNTILQTVIRYALSHGDLIELSPSDWDYLYHHLWSDFEEYREYQQRPV